LREPQQLDARKAIADFSGGGKRGRRPGSARYWKMRDIAATPDFQEGLASFLEKRKPVGRGEDSDW